MICVATQEQHVCLLSAYLAPLSTAIMFIGHVHEKDAIERSSYRSRDAEECHVCVGDRYDGGCLQSASRGVVMLLAEYK